MHSIDAYEKGKDIFELHKFARERNVSLGPNGLRTLLQIVKIWLEEKAANDRLEADMQVQENIVTTLQPLWVDLLPTSKNTTPNGDGGKWIDKAVN